MSLIPRLAFPCRILESHVRRLEDSDGKCMRPVLANCLQETRDQSCADNLELE